MSETSQHPLSPTSDSGIPPEDTVNDSNLSITNSMFFSELTFDPQKCASATIEDGGTTVMHSSEGRAYAMTTTGISQGCCEWKVSHLYN